MPSKRISAVNIGDKFFGWELTDMWNVGKSQTMIANIEISTRVTPECLAHMSKIMAGEKNSLSVMITNSRNYWAIVFIKAM